MKKNYDIKLDEDAYNLSSELFEKLGLDIDTAINMFLHKSLYEGGIPFFIGMPMFDKFDDYDYYDDEFDDFDNNLRRNNKRKKS